MQALFTKIVVSRLPSVLRAKIALHLSAIPLNRTTGKISVNTAGEKVFYDQRGSGSHPILCIPGALGKDAYTLHYFYIPVP